MPTNPAGDPLDKSYFTNSGSEANELAVLMSREFTGHHDVVALRNGYHGGTPNTMGLTAHGTWRFPQNNVTGIHHTHPGYCYRCPYDLEYPSCDLKCAKDLENVIAYQTNGEIACFIGEPIQGVGGAVVPPKEYFQTVYDIVRKHGGLCIADEVQGGFGRTGEHYWAHQHFGVQPDMVVMAKGIGNGAPLGGVTTTADIAQDDDQAHPLQHLRRQPRLHGVGPRDHGSHRSRGDPTERQDPRRPPQAGPPRHCRTNTNSSARSAAWALMLGVELVRDRNTKEPANTEAADLMELTKDRGLILGKGGLFGNTMRIKPPMCITKDDADFLLATVDECLTEIENKKYRINHRMDTLPELRISKPSIAEP